MSERIVLVAHGTRNVAGQRTMLEIAARVQQALPTRNVELAWIELVRPALTDLLPAGGPAIVVPLLLGSGYHVRVDLADAVARHPGSLLTEPLSVGSSGWASTRSDSGPSGILDALVDRIAELGTPGDAIVLAAAGSSDPRSRNQAAAVAAELEARLVIPVRPAYLSGPGPSLDEAIGRLCAKGHSSVTAAAYLLADGFFYHKLASAAERVTRPLGAHPGVIRQVVERINESTLPVELVGPELTPASTWRG